MQVGGTPDEWFLSVNPVNQSQGFRCLVGSSALWAFMPRSAGFGSSAIPEGLYCQPGGMIGSGHNSTYRARESAPVVGERRADR